MRFYTLAQTFMQEAQTFMQAKHLHVRSAPPRPILPHPAPAPFPPHLLRLPAQAARRQAVQRPQHRLLHLQRPPPPGRQRPPPLLGRLQRLQQHNSRPGYGC